MVFPRVICCKRVSISSGFGGFGRDRFQGSLSLLAARWAAGQGAAMRHTDIVIAGGGLAGSTAAAMLGRAGFDVVAGRSAHGLSAGFSLREARRLAGRLLRKTGLADAVLRAGTLDDEVLDRALRPPGREAAERSVRHSLRHAGQHDPRRDPAARRIHPRQGRRRSRPAPTARSVTLSTGEEISARLVVLANGLNVGLRHTLGMTREVVSTCHSISIGFDLEPVGRPQLRVSAR